MSSEENAPPISSETSRGRDHGAPETRSRVADSGIRESADSLVRAASVKPQRLRPVLVAVVGIVFGTVVGKLVPPTPSRLD